MANNVADHPVADGSDATATSTPIVPPRRADNGSSSAAASPAVTVRATPTAEKEMKRAPTSVAELAKMLDKMFVDIAVQNNAPPEGASSIESETAHFITL